MKKKIICIEGETASGKDSIAKYISENLNIPMVVSYTTRPMRSSEKEGREHYFVSKDEMERIKREESIFAYTKIEDKNKSDADGYEYCTTLESLKDDVFLYIIDPNGIEYIRSHQNLLDAVELLVLYIYVPYEIRYERARNSRSDFSKFETRSLQEKAQFEKARENVNYDLIVDNFDFNNAVFETEVAIRKFLKDD